MIITMLGQDIASLLPSLLADLLFQQKLTADIRIEERNPAMQDLLQRYGNAVLHQADNGSTLRVEASRRTLLAGADCVLYAGDCMLSSRFHQDRVALSAPDPEEGTEEMEEDPGLTDQARVNGGIGGLLHTLRQGGQVMDLIDLMQELCPEALVLTMGQPVARTCAMFTRAGFRCYGLGISPLRGPGGLDGLCRRLHTEAQDVDAVIAGLPDFAWLLKLTDKKNDDDDLLPIAEDAAEAGDLGRLARRWLHWWGALPVGDVTRHAEWLPAQEDYSPDPNPELGETVERRKERILWMNTVAEHGLQTKSHAQPGEGVMAQMLLLSRAPAQRPMQLAAALLNGLDLEMPAVTRINRDGEIRNLPRPAIIEAPLTLVKGEAQPHGLVLPDALAEICGDIDETSRLAAQAAAGDRSALRECIEIDPALGGLDRLYCQQLVDVMIRMHSDVITRLSDDEEEDEL